jgi:hypothetical protein
MIEGADDLVPRFLALTDGRTKVREIDIDQFPF